MDILIKSYNRPYYLDRCLFSIHKFIINSDFKIIILDDGTPKKYLEKIIEKYPKVTIEKSLYYNEKSKYTSEGLAPKSNKIPISLWINASKKASSYFLLIEDDMWFTSNLNLTELIDKINKKDIFFTKLMWVGNLNVIQNKSYSVDDNLVSIKSNIPFKNPFLYKLFFRVNRFKLRKIFSLLKIYSYKKSLSYYSIYSVAGVIFRKDYFLSLWNNHNNTVNEELQITNALTFLKNSKSKPSSFSHTTIEYLKTGFISSATNKSHLENKCNMFAFNYIINEIWFNDNFKTLENFPLDFTEDYILTLLNNNQSLVKPKEWLKWVNEFKNSFKNFGCEIE